MPVYDTPLTFQPPPGVDLTGIMRDASGTAINVQNLRDQQALNARRQALGQNLADVYAQSGGDITKMNLGGVAGIDPDTAARFETLKNAEIARRATAAQQAQEAEAAGDVERQKNWLTASKQAEEMRKDAMKVAQNAEWRKKVEAGDYKGAAVLDPDGTEKFFKLSATNDKARIDRYRAAVNYMKGVPAEKWDATVDRFNSMGYFDNEDAQMWRGQYGNWEKVAATSMDNLKLHEEQTAAEYTAIMEGMKPVEEPADIKVMRGIYGAGWDKMTPEEKSAAMGLYKKSGASSTSVTVDTGVAEKKLGERLAEKTAEKVFDNMDRAETAASTIGTIAETRQTIGKSYMGAGSNIKLGAVKVLRSLGIDVAEEDVSNTEQSRAKLGSMVAANLRSTFPGQLTEGEREYLQDIMGNISTDPAAINAILDFYEKKARETVKKHNRLAETVRDKLPFDPVITIEEAPKSTAGSAKGKVIMQNGKPYFMGPNGLVELKK